jgi:hypothetical protein
MRVKHLFKQAKDLAKHTLSHSWRQRSHVVACESSIQEIWITPCFLNKLTGFEIASY